MKGEAGVTKSGPERRLAGRLPMALPPLSREVERKGQEPVTQNQEEEGAHHCQHSRYSNQVLSRLRLRREEGAEGGKKKCCSTYFVNVMVNCTGTSVPFAC